MNKTIHSQIPQFVTIGFDDNDKSGFMPEKGSEGMKWAVDTFVNRKNPDGTKCTCAFYLTSAYITDGEAEEPTHFVKKSWKYALDNGCDIGCHTHSHPHGENFSVDEWLAEMNKCVDILSRPYVEGSDGNDTGIGIAKSEIKSFRTPYLESNDNTLIAVKKMGFVYDCSLEEGLQDDQDGTNFCFPYKLESGVWEIPAHVVIVPPDNLCEKYGIKKGLRKKCSELQSDFNEKDGKITGLDYNCFVEYQMTADEFSATLKHTLDLRLKGNRAPFTFGGHTGVYAVEYDCEPQIKISEQERRRSIEDFLDYAQSKKDVFIVSPIKILEWIKERE
jgi:peptidoglycan/xylan/chitin deacetylase (PgdA/CDA1 family)